MDLLEYALLLFLHEDDSMLYLSGKGEITRVRFEQVARYFLVNILHLCRQCLTFTISRFGCVVDLNKTIRRWGVVIVHPSGLNVAWLVLYDGFSSQDACDRQQDYQHYRFLLIAVNLAFEPVQPLGGTCCIVVVHVRCELLEGFTSSLSVRFIVR